MKAILAFTLLLLPAVVFGEEAGSSEPEPETIPDDPLPEMAEPDARPQWPELGLTPQQVRDRFGPPEGRMATQTRSIWVYRQGRVIFVDGVVAEFEWLSDAQMEALEAARAEREAAREEAALERLLAGVALRDRILELASG